MHVHKVFALSCCLSTHLCCPSVHALGPLCIAFTFASFLPHSTVATFLVQVSMLVQRFGEGRTERTTAIQALRKALDLISQDAQAEFAR